jgi:hypothetical protein
MPSNTKAGILDVRERVGFLRGALLETSLEAMEQAQPELAEAAAWLELLKENLIQYPLASAADKEAMRTELERLRLDLARVARLSGDGLEFCRQWGNLLQSAAGYLPTGEAAPIGSSTTLTLRG